MISILKKKILYPGLIFAGSLQSGVILGLIKRVWVGILLALLLKLPMNILIKLIFSENTAYLICLCFSAVFILIVLSVKSFLSGSNFNLKESIFIVISTMSFIIILDYLNLQDYFYILSSVGGIILSLCYEYVFKAISTLLILIKYLLEVFLNLDNTILMSGSSGTGPSNSSGGAVGVNSNSEAGGSGSGAGGSSSGTGGSSSGTGDSSSGVGGSGSSVGGSPDDIARVRDIRIKALQASCALREHELAKKAALEEADRSKTILSGGKRMPTITPQI